MKRWPGCWMAELDDMRIFAIGDLHLSGSIKDKEMDVFGPEWRSHDERIRKNWEAQVGADDLVLVPGDISWATRLEEAAADLSWLGDLPGKKILVRGNHDFWWSAPAKVRRALPPSVQIIQNDAVREGDTVFCGTRGWVFPVSGPLGAEDTKIFEREKIRLRLSLEAARKLRGRRLVVLMHFPPLYENATDTDFVKILEEFSPDQVVFGHLHGRILDQIKLRRLVHHGIEYNLVSADYIGFAPVELCTEVPLDAESLRVSGLSPDDAGEHSAPSENVHSEDASQI